MFSFENHRLHSDRRRLMSRVYSKSNLFSCPVLKEQNEYILGTRLQSLLEEHAKTEKPVEVFTTMLGITMDVVTAFLFGLSNSSNSIEDVEQRHLRLSQYQGRTPYAFFDREMQWAWPILAKFGVNVVPRSVDQATEGFETWVAEACDASIKDELKLQELGQASKSPSVAYVLYKALSAERELQGPDAVQRIVASEMTDHISMPPAYSSTRQKLTFPSKVAGHETSGVALTYLIYELCRNPPLQTRLQEEVKPLLSDDNAHLLPEFAALDALPFLQACTLEILRLYPPIVGPQARVTPPSGCKLGDIFVPGGLRVSARAPCLQKNPDVFADATTFRPDRWLAADGSVKTAKDAPELYRHWWAFGSGGRGCLGNHFAIHDIKIVAAYVYAHFSTGLVECGDMGQTDGYIGAPRGGRVMVKLEKA